MGPLSTMELPQSISSVSLTRLWVFGYASLIWKPNIRYASKEIGYIRGYKRRFWQGNTTHRGTKDAPGRVATLVPSSNNKKLVWGIAFEVIGENDVKKALEHLSHREIQRGGYITEVVPFYPRDSNKEPINAILFTATEMNDMYLGPAEIETMASQIIGCHGDAGPNSDYITNLADYVRSEIPEDQDEHLFLLDQRIRELKEHRNSHMQLFNLQDSLILKIGLVILDSSLSRTEIGFQERTPASPA